MSAGKVDGRGVFSDLALANLITKALYPDLYANPANSWEQTLLVMGVRGTIADALKEHADAVAELIEASHRLLDRTQIVELRCEVPGAVEQFRAALARIGGAK